MKDGSLMQQPVEVAIDLLENDARFLGDPSSLFTSTSLSAGEAINAPRMPCEQSKVAHGTRAWYARFAVATWRAVLNQTRRTWAMGVTFGSHVFVALLYGTAFYMDAEDGVSSFDKGCHDVASAVFFAYTYQAVAQGPRSMAQPSQ